MESAIGAHECFIGELPDELLVNIVGQLRIKRGFLAEEEAERQRCSQNAVIVRSLHALTLSCRKLYAITSPILYQCVIKTQGKLFIPLLFRTFFNKPSLSRHVRYIEFATLDENELEPFGKTDRHEFDERKAKILPPLHEWESTFPLNSLAGRDIVAVLTTMMENLQDASLPDEVDILKALARVPYPGRLKRLWLITREKSLRPWWGHHLSYLLRIIIADAKDDQGHISHYLSRFCLPAKECSQLAALPAMWEISLVVYDASSSQLEDHLKSYASLERFSCRWQWTDKDPHNVVDLPALHRSLQHVRRTLTHLTIDTSESAFRVEIESNIPALGSLREFKVLRYLDVAGLVLWGDDDTAEPAPLSLLLPESLEMLIIKDEWDDDIEFALLQLSADCRAYLPNLRRIQCNWRKPTADYLTEVFQVVGVDIVLAIEDA